MARPKDLTGKRFGRLVALSQNGRDNAGRVVWKCKCDCGTVKSISSNLLLSGHAVSCGCFKKDYLSFAKSTNRLSHARIRSKWRNMMSRCYSENNAEYKNYGARGILVCNEWHDLSTFAEWAYSNGYTEGSNLTIDRIDVNGNYCPENCRFVDMKTQCRNKTNNNIIEFGGQRKTIAEWSEITGINRSTIAYRNSHGIPLFEKGRIKNEHFN